MQQGRAAYLEYPFRKSHPIIRWLPSKLAAWIGENFGHDLQIPPKRDLEWTAGELNAILENNLVSSHGGKGQLQTFGYIQWECELYSGRPIEGMLSLQSERPPLPGKEPSGPSYDMISYTISLFCYDIIYDIIYDIML